MHFIDQLTLDYSGRLSVYALTRDGFLYSWGNNHVGQLGHGDNVTQLLPKAVTPNHVFDYRSIYKGFFQINSHSQQIVRGRFNSIYAYKGSVYAVSLEGELYVCGRNNKGQLCLADKENRALFHKIVGIKGTVIGLEISKKHINVIVAQGVKFRCVNGHTDFKEVPSSQEFTSKQPITPQ